MMRTHSTTILCVRRDGHVALGGDGQVTLGDTVMKANANKVRALKGGKILAGFAGASADAFTLFEKFEEKLERYPGNLPRAAVELAKDWRSDRVLRRLEALLVVSDKEHGYVISGSGELIEPDDRVLAIGSGGGHAPAAAPAPPRPRTQAPDEIRDEILPNNIIMIGPTGVGKTEIARRLARLAGAPFLKVEASKFTEVGYVGRDVESMVRELVDVAINMVRGEREDDVYPAAEARAEERLLDILLPPVPAAPTSPPPHLSGGEGRGGVGEKGERPLFVVSSKGDVTPKAPEAEQSAQDRWRRTREKLRQQLQKGELEEREVEVEVQQQGFPGLEMMQPPPGMEGPDFNFVEMLQEMMPKKKKPLTEQDFVRILTEPENALTRQYAALCASEGATLEFTPDGIKEIARIAAKANEQMENIGARRLHTVMTTLLEELLFELPDYPTKHVVFDAAGVRQRLGTIVENEDLRRYIL